MLWKQVENYVCPDIPDLSALNSGPNPWWDAKPAWLKVLYGIWWKVQDVYFVVRYR